MMVEFPFGLFSESQIHPIVELKDSLGRVKAHMAHVAQMMQHS